MGSGRAAAARTRSARSTRRAKAPGPSGCGSLDADLAAAFDRIDHDQLLAAIGSFPAREMIRDWLKAGVFESGQRVRPDRGRNSPGRCDFTFAPERRAARAGGGRRGPLRDPRPGAGETKPGSPVAGQIRRRSGRALPPGEQAEQVKAQLAEWLAPRGLSSTRTRRRSSTSEDGFDFLGFNVRRYRSKLLIKPSKAAIRRLRQRLAAEMRALRGSNAAAVIARLNPIIKGWAAYYRGVVSSKVFHTLDYQMWKLTYKWATWQPQQQTEAVDRRPLLRQAQQVQERPLGVRRSRQATPTWSSSPGPTSSGTSWSHGAASPDDPALADYWAERRRKVKPPLDNYTLRLLARQDARCPLCGDHLLTADQPPQSPNDWERWWQQVTRQAIAADYLVHHGRSGPPHNDQTRLVHASCRRGLRARRRQEPAQSTCTPSRLA